MYYCPQCSKLFERGFKIHKRQGNTSYWDCGRCGQELKLQEAWNEDMLRHFLESLSRRDKSATIVAPPPGEDYKVGEEVTLLVGENTEESNVFEIGKVPAGAQVTDVKITSVAGDVKPMKVDVEYSMMLPILQDILKALQCLNDKIDGKVPEPKSGEFVASDFQEVFAEVSQGNVGGILLEGADEIDEIHHLHNLQDYTKDELREATFFVYRGNYYGEMMGGSSSDE